MAREHEERKHGGESKAAKERAEEKKERDHEHKARGGGLMESKHDEDQEERSRESRGGREHRARGGGMHDTHAGMREASHGMELNTEGPMPGHPEDKHGGGVGKEHHKRRRRGGSSEGESSEHNKVQEYNAQGSNEMNEAGDEKPGFKKGGETHKKRRHGGMAEGEMEKPRLDRRPRRAAGGGLHNPYSSAANFSPPSNDKAGRGYEGEKVKD